MNLKGLAVSMVFTMAVMAIVYRVPQVRSIVIGA